VRTAGIWPTLAGVGATFEAATDEVRYAWIKDGHAFSVAEIDREFEQPSTRKRHLAWMRQSARGALPHPTGAKAQG